MQSFAHAEQERIRRHLLRAERLARRAETSYLDRSRRLVRALLLDELGRYRRRRRFPKNRDHRTSTPYFIDADGTRCAVAHLLELGGESALVARIAKERNNALVHELADEERLLAWLSAAGLTVEDAARIQPTYGCPDPLARVCGKTNGNVGVVEAEIVEPPVQSRTTARIVGVHGTAEGFAVGDNVQVQTGTGRQGSILVVPIAPWNEIGGGDAGELWHRGLVLPRETPNCNETGGIFSRRPVLTS